MVPIVITSFPPAPIEWTAPSSSSYTLSDGERVTYDYVRTSGDGYSTWTYDSYPTPSGGEYTVVIESTPSGYVSYSESSTSYTTPSGGHITYGTETLSNGETEDVTSSTSVTFGG